MFISQSKWIFHNHFNPFVAQLTEQTRAAPNELVRSYLDSSYQSNLFYPLNQKSSENETVV